MKTHQRIYNYIITNNLSMDNISKITGINEKRLNEILTCNECIMQLDEYYTICTALNLSLDYFSSL